MARPTLPANDTTIPQLIDYHAKHNPQSDFVIFSPEDSPNDVTHVTFLEMARAAHRVAHAIRPEHKGKNGETVAIIINCDTLLYVATLLGVMRAGLVPYPISNRNSPAAISHILETVSCHRLLTTSSSLLHLLDAVQEDLREKNFALETIELPAFETIFPKLGKETTEDLFTPYPELDSISWDDLIFYIHSSGSTGFPKSIPHTHRTLARWCEVGFMDQLKHWHKHLTFGLMPLPAFHLMGVWMQTCMPVMTGHTIGLFEPQEPRGRIPIVPGPENTLEALQKTKCDVAFVVPTFVEMWSQSEEAVAFLRSFELVIFAGGPLSPPVGDYLVSKRVNIHSVYGGTEFGSVVDFDADRDPRDWQWLKITSKAHIRWAPQGDGTFELQIINSEQHPLLIHNLPDVPGYSTKDLFEKHPTKDLWRVVGRADDVLILASGEKTVPPPIEGRILSNPYVQGAIMFGRGRNQVGVLLEPTPGNAIDPADKVALAEFRNAVWPEVEAANEEAPAFSRIFKEMIIVTSPEKPMFRTPKGSVQRKPTLAAYEREINDLYDTVASSAKANEIEPPRSWNAADLLEWVTEQAVAINEINKGKNPAPNVDLFAQGFDSLSATFLRNHIIGALRSSKDAAANKAASGITQNFIFANSTIEKIASSLATLVNPAAGELKSKSPTEAIEDMIAKYTADIPQLEAVQKSTLPPAKASVLLTGSTGGLGSYMLAKLLERDDVEKVYVFNRKSSKATLAERQRVAFEDKSLSLELLSSPKLVLVEGEDSKDKLGLTDALYEELRTSVTHIIHNAWRLDFNLSLASFEPNVLGTHNLMHLALSSPFAAHVRFVFTSSIGTSQGWDKSKGPFPEEPNLPPETAVGAGYGESKYVSDRMLWKASEKSGLRVSSIRIGQIAGGPNGYWATTDWVPILIKSSVALGALPEAQGIVTWVRFETVAQTVLDAVFAPNGAPPALSLAHPRPVPWNDVMSAAGRALAKEVKSLNGRSLPLIPFAEWIEKLEAKAASATEEDLRRIPAIKLLSFYRGAAEADVAIRASGANHLEVGALTPLVTTKMQQVSETLRNAPSLDDTDPEKWISYWKSKGLFD